jgi:hypothetical protein
VKTKLVAVAVAVLLLVVLCRVLNFDPFRIVQTVATDGAVTTSGDSVTYTPEGSNKPHTIHHGPAVHPIIEPVGLGKAKVHIQWSGLTVQPWAGFCYAGRGVEWMAGAGLLFVHRDLVEIGPVAGQHRAGAGAWGRWKNLGAGGGWAWRYEDGRGGPWGAVQFFPF